jgi:hypothetical protein
LLVISRRIHDFFPFKPYHQSNDTGKNKTNGEKIMFNRKVLVTALLAVVLLTSFVDAEVGVDGAYRHKPRRRKIAESITVTVPAMLQANLESLMNQADDQDTLQASGKVRRHPRRRKVAFESQAGYGISAADQDTLQASGMVRKQPRKRRNV